MKKIKLLMFTFVVFITFMFIGITTVKASYIVISGNSIFRKSATEAYINFISNTDGTIYYTINENSFASIEDIVLGVNAGDITGNETKTVNIESSLLSNGAKYVHIVVQDDLNNFSNILTISMPKNLYYFDDFEAYNINLYPDFFTIKYNGSNTSLQKIIYSNQNNVNKVFNGYGTYGRGLDERIQINSLTTGYAILEADISAITIDNNWYFAGIAIGPNSSDDRNIIVQVNPTTKLFCTQNHISNILFEVNTNYHVKIVVDVANDKYDYYINGIKANSEPVNAKPFTELTWFGIYNGSGTVHYDNIKFYSQTTNPKIHLITKGLETKGGTFTIDKTSAEKDEIITIVPTPEIGYRVKSVKINNNETGIINNTTNYTFTMPGEDVEVTVEFEKIPYTITVNSVEGATITPNGITNIEYGDNQDITITANTGYRLTSVKVNGVEKLPLTDNKITVTDIKENKIIVVKVEKLPLKITVNSVEGATITPNGITNIEYGDNQDITITANTGYRLTSVKINNIEKISTLIEGVLSLKDIQKDKNIIVAVEKTTQTITMREIKNGTITSDKETALQGETVTLTVTPNEGYKLKEIKILDMYDEILVKLNEDNTFTMPKYNVFILAEFEHIYLEKTITKTEQNSTVLIKGTFSGNPELVITKTEKGNEGYNSLITLVKKDKEVIGSYDISITKGDYIGKLSLTFIIGKQYEGDKITIYHKLANGETETLNTVVKDGKATITINELSPFMLAIDKEIISKKDETPQTGVNYFIGIATLITDLLIVGIIKIKKRLGNNY